MLVLLKNNIISPSSDRSFTESIATATPPVEIPIFYWSAIWKSVAILILNCIAWTPFWVKYPWKRLKGMKMLLEWICNRLKYLLKRQFFSLFRTLFKFFLTDYTVFFGYQITKSVWNEYLKVFFSHLFYFLKSSGLWLCWFFWKTI